jgi:hypothetical protein
MKSHMKRAGVYCLLVLVVLRLGFGLICEYWPVPVFVVKERVLSKEEISAKAKAWKVDEERVPRKIKEATAWEQSKEKLIGAEDLRQIRSQLAWSMQGYLPSRIEVVDTNSVEVSAAIGNYYKNCSVRRRDGRWMVISETSGRIAGLKVV